MKKLEIEKTKPTFIISVLKVDIIKVGLVFSISNFFITKTPLANNWRRKKIPSCSYSALGEKHFDIGHGLLNRWTSHWLFRGAKKYDWGGGAWDPNYDPGADFLDHNFLSSKNSG